MTDFQLREVFNLETVHYIAKQINESYKEFDSDQFIELVEKDLEPLSFGDRSELITNVLDKFLPSDKKRSINIIIESLGPEIESGTLSGYDGFYTVPFNSYIARYGIEHFDLAMKALYETTKRFSAESPIRKFIRYDWNRVKSYFKKWVKDPNPLVRRLVSEGSRPRLPLSSPLQIFIDEPDELFPFLLELRNDPYLLVRRSVANNINDISKDNPETVIRLLKQFDLNSKHQTWIVKHSLRTLLKQTYPPALEIIGYSTPPQVTGIKLKLIHNQIEIGSTLVFELDFLVTENDQKLLVHYVIHYMKKNGKTKPKTFILRDTVYSKGEYTITGKQSFRQMSTRKHYPGTHYIKIRVNGISFDKIKFKVINENSMNK